MTTILLSNTRPITISAPIDLDVIVPLVEEVYGKDVADWITNNKKSQKPAAGVLGDYNIGSAGDHSIEIDFFADSSIELIKIK